ncbi:DeoR family transcriptional regulator, fructose operon transcriptional repressor [Spiroplasma helicoides]|uniref:DeoR family transcriptional regulator, fructose operon transcriptional repressor n=1 Tax=Spiroplasma helicoides TaxID=216938 RepID=A0A1B3SKX4_9MOLU|nr:DeoR/GlpR family DNA-binding transcription regulator [Spiroplasma helicoides]AOG60584.1 DeoR family transcriptional regulator, fructose operon transcriptional repressor [Spiroplasma helicoides]
MLREERLKLILDFVNANGYCSNEDISKALGIPFTTLRRDLTDLNTEQKLKRVHGGAKSIKERSILEETLDQKLTSHIEEKKIIAQKALVCIKKGETVFLDAGSSTYFLAQLITPELNVRVYTNSIINAQVLANNGVSEIHILPGKLKLSTNAICGVETIVSMSKFHFDVSFLGVNAVDNDFNFYTTDEDEALVKVKAIENSQFAFALVDNSKMKSKAFIKFSDKSQIALISEEV